MAKSHCQNMVSACLVLVNLNLFAEHIQKLFALVNGIIIKTSQQLTALPLPQYFNRWSHNIKAVEIIEVYRRRSMEKYHNSV